MVDLHIHTSGSDGIFDSKVLAEKCKESKISHYAVCDHDTVISLANSVTYASQLGINCITGIELSCEFPPGDFHLLGYNIDYTNSHLLELLHFYNDQRKTRIDKILVKLKELGIEISKDELHLDEDVTPGKPHIARALVRRGFYDSVDDVFETLLGRGMKADVPKIKIPIDDAFNIIKESGGRAVLAHPASLRLNENEVYSLLKEMKPKGLYGLEVYANMHSDEYVKTMMSFADELKLIKTGGSDFHGDKEGELIGHYGYKRPIPESVIEGLME
jgi:predicted metal-dependent phosphoesterase TrpH